jgi:1-acyl-sn-glycerol-3-phosphate acyltransferase
LFYTFTFFFPEKAGKKIAILVGDYIWGYGMWLCLFLSGIKVRYEGFEAVRGKQVLLASKHQSAIETCLLRMVSNMYNLNPVFVAKAELFKIPFWGGLLKKSGTIPVKRSGSLSDLNSMVKIANDRIRMGHSIIIFPEGTRKRIGEKPDYKMGIGILYAKLGLPVLPVALNTGTIYPKKSFFIGFGEVVIKALEPIEQGYKPKEFLKILEDRIESETDQLVNINKRKK